jgi:hypothetical protein
VSRSHAPAPKGARCAVPPERCTPSGQVQAHAVLGRGDDGHYIKPVVLIALCEPDDHQLGVHHLLRREGLDGKRRPSLGVLLGRIGCAFAWLGWSRKGEVALPAEVFADLGACLLAWSRELREGGQ